MVATSRKKSPNRRKLFEVDRKSVSLAERENLFKNAFLLDENIAYIS